MKKIEWLCSLPTPYNDCFFRALHKNPTLDLEVTYKNLYLDSYPWEEKEQKSYNFRSMSGVLGVDLTLVKRIFFEKDVVFVIGGWHSSFWFIISLLCLNTSKFLVWADTPNDTTVRPFFRTLVREFWLKLIFKNSFALLGTGEPCVNKLVLMGADKSKVFNFPYWTPVKERPSEKEISNDDPIKIISVGRLIEVKGFDYLIEAASKVHEIRPLLKLEYVICGDGPDREELEYKLENHGLSDLFTITGWLESDKVNDHLQSSHIYVHTAKWEPYGVAILEAMASGLPILGSDNTMAVLDRVEHGVTGFIHNTGNIDMLASQIIDMAENPEKISKMAISSYETAAKYPVEFGVQELLRFADIKDN